MRALRRKTSAAAGEYGRNAQQVTFDSARSALKTHTHTLDALDEFDAFPSSVVHSLSAHTSSAYTYMSDALLLFFLFYVA
jgi:hypothetical protein